MSVKKNFLFSLILTASNYIFPLLVYPYVSRVLGVEGVGICNFADSILNYFILFATIGISIIGIREIASSKNDKKQLNIVFTSLIMHILLPTIVTCVIFAIALNIIPQLHAYNKILYIGMGKILGTAFLLDWFYKGIEDFKFITIRTILIKISYVISVFLFVRTQEDYIIYFLLTTLMVLINSCINVMYARKFVRISFDFRNFKSLVKPNFINGFYLFLNTMYSTLNVAYLGFISTPKEVGYYTTATKVFGIILAVYSAFTGVLLPRMSYLLSENRIEDFNNLIKKSIDILFTFSIPIFMVFTILGPSIINVISGPGYEGAYIPAIISMPLIFVVGYEQILVIQIITPMRMDRIKLINSIVGATVGVVGNLLLVKAYLSTGATIVWALSEMSVLLSAQYFVYKKLGISFPIKSLLKNISYYLPLTVLVYFIVVIDLNSMATLCLSMLILGIYFYIIQVKIVKNNLVISAINNLRIKK